MKPFEKKMIKMINKERVVRGLSELRPSEHLSDIARKHSVEQKNQNTIYHISPIYQSDHAERLKRNKYIFKTSGENVATAPSLNESHKILMESPGHYKNIVGKWTEIGIGIAKNWKGQLFVTQLFAIPAKIIDTKHISNEITINIKNYRKKKNLPEIQIISLTELGNYTFNHNQGELDTLLKKALIEAENYGIEYTEARIFSFQGFENAGSDQQLQMIKQPKINALALSINQDSEQGILYGVFLFFELKKIKSRTW